MVEPRDLHSGNHRGGRERRRLKLRIFPPESARDRRRPGAMAGRKAGLGLGRVPPRLHRPVRMRLRAVRPGAVDPLLDQVLGQSRDFVRQQHPDAGADEPAVGG